MGPGSSGSVGTAVVHPLVGLLLPEVRGGGAPAAASTLLASLLKSFPQHAAADGPAEGVGGAAGGDGSVAAGGAAAAAAGASAEFATLRLHQSASFTIDSILR